jgi:hypothetical protein
VVERARVLVCHATAMGRIVVAEHCCCSILSTTNNAQVSVEYELLPVRRELFA